MRITYDPKYDVLYIKFGNTEKVTRKNVDENITIDLDEQGNLSGIEILSASKRIDLNSLPPENVK